jgi:hypothetical protein
MKNIRFLSVVILFTLLVINACSAPPSSPDQSIEMPEEASASENPAPVCPDISAYGKIYDHWPSGFKLVTTNPELTWFYSSPGGNLTNVEEWANKCKPDSYTIYLSTGPDFDDEIVIDVVDPVITSDITKLTMEWTIPGGLEPMKVYRWAVVGHAGGLNLEEWKIADLHDDSVWPPLNTVNMAYKRCTFRTGPECASGQIEVPTLTYPVDGQTIDTLTPIITWDVAGCMPLVFMGEISTTSSFANPQPYIDTSLPGDYTWQQQRNYTYAAINYALRDCTKYYWRVQGGIGEGGALGPREWGSFSSSETFFVNLGQCPTPTPTAIPPTRTPTPTETPEPFSCEGLGMDACNAHSNVCEWVVPPPTQFKPAYCTGK